MIRRSSLKWPIVLGVILLVLIVALLVFWIIAQATQGQWALMTLGIVFFSLILIGVVLYFVLTLKEIRLTRRQANFIDSVTHELKSPIASLKLYLQTMQIRNVDEQQQREFHTMMMEDVERLDSLIDHLLVAAKLDHDQREEPIEDISLLPILQSCREEILRRYNLAPDQVTLTCPELAVVRGRPKDVEIIVTNLMDNAAKYAGTPAQVQVMVEPRLHQRRLVLKISDNGKGISFDLRRKLFRRFERGGSELERTTQGTGLGLYLVKSLVDGLKGRIHVHGRGILKGATFDVDLPGEVLPEPEKLS